MLGLAVVAWQDHLLRQAGRPDLVLLGAFAAVPVATLVSASTAGAVPASRRSRHPVGWLLLGVGLSLAANGVAAGYLRYGLLARPGARPAIRLVAVSYPATLFTAQVLLGLVLLLTPTGSLPSPSWRWWARALVAALVAVLGAVALAPGLVDPRGQAANGPFDFRGLGGALLAANQVALAVTTVAVVVGAASLVVPIVAAGWPWGPAQGWLTNSWPSAWRGCRWRSPRRSCAIGCTTWTASSAAP